MTGKTVDAPVARLCDSRGMRKPAYLSKMSLPSDNLGLPRYGFPDRNVPNATATIGLSIPRSPAALMAGFDDVSFLSVFPSAVCSRHYEGGGFVLLVSPFLHYLQLVSGYHLAVI